MHENLDRTGLVPTFRTGRDPLSFYGEVLEILEQQQGRMIEPRHNTVYPFAGDLLGVCGVVLGQFELERDKYLMSS